MVARWVDNMEVKVGKKLATKKKWSKVSSLKI
jgi:hypothetical protein